MENEKKPEGSCCSNQGCGSCGCRCGVKLIAAVVLLLLGGVIGYLMGSHCARRMAMACPMEMPMRPAK